MASNQTIPEGILVEHLEKINLPPVWRVIYYEATRDNHLLFDAEEIKHFRNSHNALTSISGDEEYIENIETIAMSIWSCQDITSMRSILAKLSQTTKKDLFILYNQTITFWRHQFKKAMN